MSVSLQKTNASLRIAIITTVSSKESLVTVLKLIIKDHILHCRPN